MFQILGGFFPGAYFDWLNEKEKSKFLKITGYFEQTVYLNSSFGGVFRPKKEVLSLFLFCKPLIKKDV